MRNTGRIPSSDGNLIIFRNLDIPIAIEVPRFPLLYVLSSLFWFFYFFSFLLIIYPLVARYIGQNQGSAVLAIEIDKIPQISLLVVMNGPVANAGSIPNYPITRVQTFL
jgi:hypothetical protein